MLVVLEVTIYYVNLYRKTVKVFERAQDGCRLVKPMVVKPLSPLDTFRSHHQPVITLWENVGGTVGVFLRGL